MSYVVPVKSKVKISQKFVAFSENMNFTIFISEVWIGAKSEEDLGDLRTAETGRIMKAGAALAFVNVGPFLAQIFHHFLENKL